MVQQMVKAQNLRRITFSVFQSPEDGASKHGKVVAITSPLRGEGVTYVSRLLCRELAGDQFGRTLYCTAEAIANASLEHGSEDHYSVTDAGYWTLTSSDGGAASAWDFNPAVRCARLETLRKRFDYIVLDCPAICQGGDLSGIGSLADSILLVVGAGRSNKQQLAYAQQVIAESGGTLQGCVLNRREYPVPNALYRWLKGGPR